MEAIRIPLLCAAFNATTTSSRTSVLTSLRPGTMMVSASASSSKPNSVVMPIGPAATTGTQPHTRTRYPAPPEASRTRPNVSRAMARSKAMTSGSARTAIECTGWQYTGASWLSGHWSAVGPPASMYAMHAQIVLYDGFDPFDVVAPFEVLAAGSEYVGGELVVTLVSAEGPRSVTSGTRGLTLTAVASLDPAKSGCVLVPGASGPVAGDPD